MIQPRFETVMEVIRRAVEEVYGPRLITLAVFGSVGRGAAGPESGVDLLVIARELPYGRMARVSEF